LRAQELRVETERQVGLKYRGQPVPTRLRLDLLVQMSVVVEVKAVP
jgi:GxxExxY protein